MNHQNSTYNLSLPTALLFIAGIFIASVVVIDVIGVVAITLKDLLFFSKKSMLFLAYPIWIVAAIFNGAYYTLFAFDKLKRNITLAGNTWIIAVVATIISAIAIYIFTFYGQMKNDKYDYYVPGNGSLTYTFFVTLIISTLFFVNMENWKLNKFKKQNGT